ncbi:adenine deaminase C-terminal domain-containing protein, partial [Enterococcus faecalis]|uniref:adenine deaminase C-terminal domain-containing protein n=1 Tax=Enterococcus faecalis TaxID=1351 RepID=UPI00325A84B5
HYVLRDSQHLEGLRYAEHLCEKVNFGQKVRQAMQALGYQNMNEIMSFSTLSLPVSPAIKVTDFGMMDTKSQRFYPLVFPEDGVLLHENTH